MKEYEKTALIYALKESSMLIFWIILFLISCVGLISGAIYSYNLIISLFESNPTATQFTVSGFGLFIVLLQLWIPNTYIYYSERIGKQPSTIKDILEFSIAAIFIISFITMALTITLFLKDMSNIWLGITFIALFLSFYCIISVIWSNLFNDC